MRNPHNDALGDPETAGGGNSAPERRCILGSGENARAQLIRLAIGPDGSVLPDVLARAPGRGAWIGVARAELDQALAKGRLKAALARAYKGQPLTIPDDLPARIEAALTRAFTERLGLALKSGALLMGSEKIAQAARSGAVEWLAHAADASPDGARKIDQAWRVGRGTEGSGEAGLRLPLDRAALSVALGRENVVHLALTEPVAAEKVDGLLRRLLHYMMVEPAPSGSDLPGAV